ncbi:two-component system histidine kinase PnpS [Desulfitobacterium sp.]|uniref:two-component system histidine kinase PnpS n=1 Tax=Desulfitobacterium sp. TaxID=49981 RepID=UPI002CA6FE64|nr:ATP-binding protein [Desulfitobacterium sp.]HVJ48211.1 ATP-binding protein [Desulfitobacterium sp.]
MSIKWKLLIGYLTATSLSLSLFWLGEGVVNGKTTIFDWTTFILAIFLPGGVIYYLANRFSHRLEKLNTIARAISKGDFNKAYFFDSTDELGQIGTEMIALAQKFKVHLQKNTQEAEKIQTILAGMQEGVVALDQVGRVVLVNAAAEKIFAHAQEELKGKYLTEVQSNGALQELVQNALEEGRSGSTELALGERTLRVQVNPFLGEETQTRPRGAVIVCYDVTEIRRLEQVRTEFVGNVSHELRTPLTSIKGFVETLLDGAAEDPALRKRFLTIIQTETLRLQRIIDDLLTLSHIENRHGELGVSSSRVQEAYEKIKPVIASYAEAKGLELVMKFKPDLPAVAMGPDLLSQVLLNLLENAVKYTAKGKVWLSASQSGSFVRLEFGDTGCGIPEQDLPRIFERFYRVDKARSREQGGTGLGLSIVKHIVEGSNGKLGVTSRLGSGSVFTCELPVAEQGE